MKKLLFSIAVILAASAGSAQGANSPRLIELSFAPGYIPPAVFAWGQTLEYRYTMKSDFAAPKNITLKFQGFEMNGKEGGLATTYQLHYHLQPGQSIPIKYDVVPPTPANIYQLMEFDMFATATVSGAPQAMSVATSYHGQ